MIGHGSTLSCRGKIMPNHCQKDDLFCRGKQRSRDEARRIAVNFAIVVGIRDDLRLAVHSLQKAKPSGGALLDLRRNLTQPFLSAICPSLMGSDSCLEIIYLIVCGSKLIREILSGLSCLSEFSLSRLSREFNKLKNGVPCPVHYLGFRGGTFPFRSIRDNGFLTHRTLPNPVTSYLEYFVILRSCRNYCASTLGEFPAGAAAGDGGCVVFSVRAWPGFSLSGWRAALSGLTA
jgi:hypothetical protein